MQVTCSSVNPVKCGRHLAGVGGNLVAVQASRLSTSLHLKSQPGVLPDGAVKGCPNPISVFCAKGNWSNCSHVNIGLQLITKL